MPRKSKTPPGHVTISGNTFTPSDIDHLVSGLQVPPTDYEKEVEEELNRLQAEQEKKSTPP